MISSMMVIGGLMLSATGAGQNPCQAGIWALESESRAPGGRRVLDRASSTRYCHIHGGAVEMDEFRLLNDIGQVLFLGVSFRYPHDDGSGESVLWLMLGDPGHTIIEGEFRDGVLYSEGTGVDGRGAFRERSNTTYDEAGGTVFRMDRQYDGEWIDDFNVLRATRVQESAPPLPQAPVVRHPAMRSAGTWHHAGRVASNDGFQPRHRIERRWPILDGAAMAAEITELGLEDQVLARHVVFEARYGDTWRVTRWTPASGDLKSWQMTDSAPGAGRPASPGSTDLDLVVESRAAALRVLERAGEDLAAEWWLHAADPERPYGDPVVAKGCGDFEFVLGDFRMDAWTLDADRQVVAGTGFVSGYRLLDGGMIGAEMHVLFSNGTGFRGITLRTRDANGAWQVNWLPVGGPASPGGHTREGEQGCVEHHRGEDTHGTFTQPLRLTAANDGFDVVMDRQYLGGGPLIESLWAYRARRLPRAD